MENLEALERFKVITGSISCITPFDGDKNSLFNFINRVECLIPIFESFDNNYKRIILGLIKDKVIGKARESLLINGDAETWNDLKTVLIRNHGESASIDNLVDKIRTCRCKTTIEDFYQRLTNLLCRLNNAYLLEGRANNEEVTSNQRITLHAFKHGLPEPVKSIIISRNPETLTAAYDIIKTNGYLHYTNKRNNGYGTYRKPYNNYNNNINNNNTNNFNNKPTNNFNNRPTNNYNNRPTNSYNNTNQSGHSRLSRNTRQNSFQFRQPFNRLPVNDYAQNNNNYNDIQEPMDISVNETGNQRNFPTGGQNNYPI